MANRPGWSDLHQSDFWKSSNPEQRKAIANEFRSYFGIDTPKGKPVSTSAVVENKPFTRETFAGKAPSIQIAQEPVRKTEPIDRVMLQALERSTPGAMARAGGTLPKAPETQGLGEEIAATLGGIAIDPMTYMGGTTIVKGAKAAKDVFAPLVTGGLLGRGAMEVHERAAVQDDANELHKYGGRADEFQRLMNRPPKTEVDPMALDLGMTLGVFAPALAHGAAKVPVGKLNPLLGRDPNLGGELEKAAGGLIGKPPVKPPQPPEAPPANPLAQAPQGPDFVMPQQQPLLLPDRNQMLQQNIQHGNLGFDDLVRQTEELMQANQGRMAKPPIVQEVQPNVQAQEIPQVRPQETIQQEVPSTPQRQALPSQAQEEVIPTLGAGDLLPAMGREVPTLTAGDLMSPPGHQVPTLGATDILPQPRPPMTEQQAISLTDQMAAGVQQPKQMTAQDAIRLVDQLSGYMGPQEAIALTDRILGMKPPPISPPEGISPPPQPTAGGTNLPGIRSAIDDHGFQRATEGMTVGDIDRLNTAASIENRMSPVENLPDNQMAYEKQATLSRMLPDMPQQPSEGALPVGQAETLTPMQAEAPIANATEPPFIDDLDLPPIGRSPDGAGRKPGVMGLNIPTLRDLLADEGGQSNFIGALSRFARGQQSGTKGALKVKQSTFDVMARPWREVGVDPNNKRNVILNDGTDDLSVPRAMSKQFQKNWVKVADAPDGQVFVRWAPKEATRQLGGKLMDEPPTPVTKVGRKPYVAKPIKMENVTDDPNAGQLLKETFEADPAATQAARRGTISKDQRNELADLIGGKPDKLLNRKTGEAWNAENIEVAKRELRASADMTLKLRDKAMSDKATLEDLNDFMMALERHEEVQQSFFGVRAEAGRAVQALKGAPKEMNVTATQMREALERYGGMSAVQKLAEKIDSAEALGKLNADRRRFNKPMEVFYNFILSAAPTHAANVAANSISLLLKFPEVAVSSAMSGGKRVKAGEMGVQMAGAFRALGEAAQSFAQAGKSGVSKFDTTSMDTQTKAIGGKVGELVRMPQDLLTAEDDFFKVLHYRMELSTLAYREGVNKGLKGKDLSKFVDSTVAAPGEAMHTAALEEAHVRTFTKKVNPEDGWSDTVAHGVTQFKSKYPVATLITPFVRTPLRIAQAAAEKGPLAPLMKGVRENIKAGGVKRDQQLSRTTLGLVTLAGISKLVTDGLITGGGPPDAADKKTLERTGWLPYAIKIGDEYHTYNRLGDWAIVVGMAADLTDMVDRAAVEKTMPEGIQTAVLGVAIALVKNLANQTFLQGINNFFAAMSDPERRSGTMARQIAGSVVPANMASVSREMDPTIRDVKTVIDQIISRGPGEMKSLNLPAKVDIFGEEEVRTAKFAGQQLISPVRTSAYKGDKAADEMARLKVNISPIGDKLDGVEMDPFIAAKLRTVAGKDVRKAVDSLVTSRDYRNSPDDVKAEEIRKAVRKARVPHMKEYREMLKVQSGK